MIDEVEEIDVDTTTNLPSSDKGNPSDVSSDKGADGDGDGESEDGGDQDGGDQESDKESESDQDGGDQDGGDQESDKESESDQDGGDENTESEDDGDEDGGDKESEKEDESDQDGGSEEEEPEEIFNSLAIEIAQDVKNSFSEKGYANPIEKKGGTFMYLWQILFGASFLDLFRILNEVNGLTKVEIDSFYSDEHTYDELLEFDKEVAKKMVRTMRDYPNYFDVENAYGHILYDTLKKIGALNYRNFDYVVGTGINLESMCTYNDGNFIFFTFVSVQYRINKTITLQFDTKNKLTNFVSLYSNNEELNDLWIILHQLAIELLPYRSDEQNWINSINYPEFNNIISMKILKQLETLQNAVI